MIFETIRLHNFGPFNGDHEINFGDGYGVHIVRGGNGQGKTSLQRALIWALYGKVVDRNGQEIPLTSLLNHASLKDGIYKFGVQIIFNQGTNTWNLIRQTEAKSHNNSKYKENTRLDIVIDGKVLKNPQYEIQRILPYEVSRFYFFDGEMLQEYEELLDQDNPPKLLKNSIELVLGVPHIKNAVIDLNQIKKNHEKDRSRKIRNMGGKNYQEILSIIDIINEEIEFYDQELSTARLQISNTEDDLRIKQKELADLAGRLDLIRNKDLTDSKIEELNRRKNYEYKQMSKLAAQLYKTILAPLANDVLTQLDEKYKAGIDRYNNKQMLLGRKKNLELSIRENTCQMCKNPLNKDVARRLELELESILNKLNNSDVSEEPNLEYITYRTSLEKIISENVRDEIKTQYDEIYKIDNDLFICQNTLDDITKLLSEIDVDEPNKLQRMVNSMREELGRLKQKEFEINKKLGELQEDRNLNESYIRGIKEIDLTKMNTKLDYIDNIRSLFEEAISEYRDNTKSDIENIATLIFKKIRSKEIFDSLEINDHFGLNIVTQRGTKLDRSEWRSSGEEQLVALALIGSLNKCTQIKAPVVMDTPFARLDKEHVKRLLSYIPELSGQVILLVTDREYREDDEKYLEGKIKSDNTLIYKNELEGSYITPTRTEVVQYD